MIHVPWVMPSCKGFFLSTLYLLKSFHNSVNILYQTNIDKFHMGETRQHLKSVRIIQPIPVHFTTAIQHCTVPIHSTTSHKYSLIPIILRIGVMTKIPSPHTIKEKEKILVVKKKSFMSMDKYSFQSLNIFNIVTKKVMLWGNNNFNGTLYNGTIFLFLQKFMKKTKQHCSP